MSEAFARVAQALGGALVIAERLFDSIPGSYQMIVSAGAMLLVVKYFVLPIVGVGSILGGASDQVIENKGLRRRHKGTKRG